MGKTLFSIWLTQQLWILLVCSKCTNPVTELLKRSENYFIFDFCEELIKDIMVFYEFDDLLFYWKVNVFKPKNMSESSEVNGPGIEKPE